MSKARARRNRLARKRNSLQNENRRQALRDKKRNAWDTEIVSKVPDNLVTINQRATNQAPASCSDDLELYVDKSGDLAVRVLDDVAFRVEISRRIVEALF